ncbi:MAG: dihydroneopterin aldolase [Prevotella sp.]
MGLKTSIFINNIRFHAYHGVMPQENIVGADFTVSVRIGYNFTKAAESDNVEDTVSYADIYELLRSEIAISSKLLEHVAWRMVESIRSHFPDVDSIDLTLTKLNPPMGAECDGAGVEMHWTSLNNDKTIV